MNTEKNARKHSGLGIASLIIGIILDFFIILSILSSNPYIQHLAQDDYFFILYGLISLIAFGLGIAGLIQKDKKKLFGILGTVFSIAPILIVIFITLFVLIYGTG